MQAVFTLIKISITMNCNLYSFTKRSFWVTIILVNNMGKIVDKIKNKNLIIRLICLLVGSFCATLVYNKFLVPNNIVMGGISGLAIVIKEAFHIDTTLFINASNVILVVLSFIMLGKKKTLDLLVGCIMYLLMLNVTAPIAKNINFTFESDMLMLLFLSIAWGVSTGLIYRAGYSTGGSDFLTAIISERVKKPITSISLIIQVLVIILGAIVFSVPQVMYSIFVIYLSNKVTDIVLFGLSTSKMVYVISKENDVIEDYIMNVFKTGATEIKVHGGVFQKKRQMMLCVVHNVQYQKFKNTVLSMDPDAFLISNNCYEVNGGKKLNILPF